MGHHVPGDESPFLKRVLIPFWVVRILIMVIEIGIYGLAIGVLGAWENNKSVGNYQGYNLKASVHTAIAVIAVFLAIILICLLLDVVCIIKRARRTLTPRFFLIVNVVQTTWWTIGFVASFFGAFSAFSMIVSIIVYLSFLGLLIYASIIFHKHRKGTLRGRYSPAMNKGPEEHQFSAENIRYGVPAEQGYSQSYPQSSYENRGMASGQQHTSAAAF